MRAPRDRMFSIKLIHPNHLKIPALCPGADDRAVPPLMNFSADGRGPATAAGLPLGHRSLVYVIREKKFVWAIEFIGTLDEGQQIARARGMEPTEITTRWSLFRPIRFLATIDVTRAPLAAEVCQDAGVSFTPNSFTLKYISGEEYEKLYAAIPWEYSSGEQRRSIPSVVQEVAPGFALTPITGERDDLPDFCLPPVLDAERLLDRIRAVRGMPERNMEDVVKALLVALGHPENSICFQMGHLDIRVNDAESRPRMVLEVKRSLGHAPSLADARRKASDYSLRVGAALFVITDADKYEVYDRARGHDYESMCCGRFQLTQFRKSDEPVLELLRSPNAAMRQTSD